MCFSLNAKRCTWNWRWSEFYPLEKRTVSPNLLLQEMSFVETTIHLLVSASHLWSCVLFVMEGTTSKPTRFSLPVAVTSWKRSGVRTSVSYARSNLVLFTYEYTGKAKGELLLSSCGLHFGLRLLSPLRSLIKIYVYLTKKYMSSVHRRGFYLMKVYVDLYKYMSIKYYCLELLLFETKHHKV